MLFLEKFFPLFDNWIRNPPAGFPGESTRYLVLSIENGNSQVSSVMVRRVLLPVCGSPMICIGFDAET